MDKTDKIRKAFKNYFDEFNIELPKKLAPKGTIADSGWSITYVLSNSEKGEPCLDFLAEHRMTNMRHVRIHQNGEVEQLDAIQETYAYDSKIKGDEERAQKEFHQYNERVEKQLRDKNLL